MALNDELLNLHEKLKYYSFETFSNVPSEPGVYAWLYPLRIKGRELKSFIEEINLVFNFYNDGGEDKMPKAEVNMGWRKYSIGTEFIDLPNYRSFLKDWENIWLKAAETGKGDDLEKLKKIIFISSTFMPPLYIGKSVDLNTRCQQHIAGTSDTTKDIFHHRFKNFAAYHKISCRNIEDLIFGCISTKTFKIEEKKYENLLEKILMNLIKPIYSIK